MKKNLFARAFIALFRPEAGWTRWVIALIIIGFLIAQNLPLFEPVKTTLKSPQFTLTIGKSKFTAFAILQGVFTVALVAWIASIISVWGERSINRLTRMSRTNRGLITTAFKIIIFFIAGFIGLNALGVNLSSLTIFSGAVGIGLGFGLQKITSNFISGVILLFEKSLEEGDLVELTGGYQGIVKKMGARYTLIETFDSKEIMIPNEDFITNRVINWTFTNSQGRVEIAFGVSYESDIEKARLLALEAAAAHPRCSQSPVPQCFLTEYGDSSVNFLLYFWVDDVTTGRLEPKSDVMRAIWKTFKENGIGIPFPQRDIYIKNFQDKPK